jgi:GTP-binding protein HflX
VYAKDELFATLDPTSRRLRFPREKEVVITDTVGFIRDLPDTLVNAFRATLEELNEADLLLHVIDAADPLIERQMQSVEKVLTGLELDNKPRLLVFNKCDQVHPMDVIRFGEGENAVAISALKREGFDALLKKAAEYLWPEDSEGLLPSAEATDWQPSLD